MKYILTLERNPPGNGTVLLELLAKLGVIPRLRKALHVQVGPVRLPRAVVAAHEVTHVHLAAAAAATTTARE